MLRVDDGNRWKHLPKKLWYAGEGLSRRGKNLDWIEDTEETWKQEVQNTLSQCLLSFCEFDRTRIRVCIKKSFRCWLYYNPKARWLEHSLVTHMFILWTHFSSEMKFQLPGHYSRVPLQENLKRRIQLSSSFVTLTVPRYPAPLLRSSWGCIQQWRASVQSGNNVLSSSNPAKENQFVKPLSNLYPVVPCRFCKGECSMRPWEGEKAWLWCVRLRQGGHWTCKSSVSLP